MVIEVGIVVTSGANGRWLLTEKGREEPYKVPEMVLCLDLVCG